MPEQFLDATQVMARFQEMSRERMPEEVRIDVCVDSLVPRPVLDASLDGPWRQAGAPAADEQCCCIRVGQGRACHEPRPERPARFPADRHDAIFSALARDPGGGICKIDVMKIEVTEFGQSQPGRIKQLEYRPVPVDKRTFAVDLQQRIRPIQIATHDRVARHDLNAAPGMVAAIAVRSQRPTEIGLSKCRHAIGDAELDVAVVDLGLGQAFEVGAALRDRHQRSAQAQGVEGRKRRHAGVVADQMDRAEIRLHLVGQMILERLVLFLQALSLGLEIGYLTPPVGLNLFVASALYEKGLGHVIRSVAPFVGLMLIGLGVITWYPQLSIGLGNAIMGGDPNQMLEADEEGNTGMPTMEEMMQEAMAGEDSYDDDDDDSEDDAEEETVDESDEASPDEGSDDENTE